MLKQTACDPKQQLVGCWVYASDWMWRT